MNLLRNRHQNEPSLQEIDPRALEWATKWVAEDIEAGADVEGKISFVSAAASEAIKNSLGITPPLPVETAAPIIDTKPKNDTSSNAKIGARAVAVFMTAGTLVFGGNMIQPQVAQAESTSEHGEVYNYAGGAGAGQSAGEVEFPDGTIVYGVNHEGEVFDAKLRDMTIMGVGDSSYDRTVREGGDTMVTAVMTNGGEAAGFSEGASIVNDATVKLSKIPQIQQSGATVKSRQVGGIYTPGGGAEELIKEERLAPLRAVLEQFGFTFTPDQLPENYEGNVDATFYVVGDDIYANGLNGKVNLANLTVDDAKAVVEALIDHYAAAGNNNAYLGESPYSGFREDSRATYYNQNGAKITVLRMDNGSQVDEAINSVTAPVTSAVNAVVVPAVSALDAAVAPYVPVYNQAVGEATQAAQDFQETYVDPGVQQFQNDFVAPVLQAVDVAAENTEIAVVNSQLPPEIKDPVVSAINQFQAGLAPAA